MISFLKLASLLEEMGIPFEKVCDENHWTISHGFDVWKVYGTDQSEHDAIKGCHGFYTTYYFDTSGNFLYVGAWE